MSSHFKGKVALVTGAAQGIGRAAAILFAQHGARVVVSDIAAAAAEVIAEIEEAGGEAVYVRCDVSNSSSVSALIDTTIEKFGKLDCAFNNAGIIVEADAAWDEDAYEKTFSVNARGVFNCLKFEIPAMLGNGGGTIVNSASIYGLMATGVPAQPGYCGSKHAVIGITRTAALKYAKQNIRVNAVCPGVIMTPMTRKVAEQGPEMLERLNNFAPVGRVGRPEDVAEAAIWLCSEKAAYVTGHALAVDGGVLAG